MMTKPHTILLVDDDEEFVASVQLLLEREGYAVVTAPNGSQGLRLARMSAPDAIVLDVMMDHTTEGIELSREIRSIPELARVPILLVTGIRRELTLPFAFEADDAFLPVTRVIEKPVDPQFLLNVIKKVLNDEDITNLPAKGDIMERKALIVDDNPEFAASMAELLKTDGYTVATATDGAQGYEKAVANKPDLVLMDVMMEDCGAGLDTVRKLREDDATRNIPVFLVTGIRKPQLLLQSYAPGENFPNVKGVFEKPVKPEEFVAALAKVA